jgi:PAS domain S-box-containing protein
LKNLRNRKSFLVIPLILCTMLDKNLSSSDYSARKFGIELVGNINWGTHLCQFYETKQDLIDILVPYFVEGLRSNEFCMWVTSPPLEVGEAKSALKKAVPNLEEYLKKEQLEIISYANWYLLDGKFDSNRVLQGWVEKEQNALKKGFEGLRLSGNTLWIERPLWQSFVDYEEAVNVVIGEHKMMALCTYCLKNCSGTDVLDVVRNHIGTLVKQGDKWVLVEDVLQRRKTEEALRVSEQRWATTLASIGDAVIATDVLGEITFMNRKAEELTGWTKNECPQKPVKTVLNIFNEQTHVEVENPVYRVLKEGVVVGLANHTILRRKDGVEIPIDDSGAPIRDKNGTLTGAVLVFRDITERKKSEEALSRINEELEERVQKRTQEVSSERQRLYNVLETLPAYVVLLDKDYRMPFANKVFRGLFGESHGRRCHDFLFGRDSECENCKTYKVLKTNKPQHWEWKGPNGCDYDVYDFPFVEPDGSIQILEMGIDITERNRAEERIRTASLYARSLIEASLDPLVTINPEGKITDVNKATEIATGRSRAELISSDFSEYFIEPEKAKSGYKRVFTEGLVKDYPLAIRHKNGKVTDVLYNATVYTNNAGEIQGVFAAARDITELKRAEKQAQEAARKLKDSERLATIGATAGMVGHDIRNPLQAIISDLFLAKSELTELPDNEKTQNVLESLAEIEENVDYINKIVADLQDYARPLNPRVLETDIKSVFDGILAKNVVPKNIRVDVAVEEKAEKIMADPDYFKRIFSNLILNAFQAMPDGGKLTIRAYVDKQTDDILLTVTDTGVGIPEDVKPKLFTPMMTTKSKGQGFGLAVVKRMTEGLGGTVTFESTEGKGTTFTVRLPLLPKS